MESNLWIVLQQTPVIIAGNKEQQKKYLGRLIEEPLVAVSVKDKGSLDKGHSRMILMCAGLLRDWAWCGLWRERSEDPSREEGRRVDHQRTEDVDHQRRSR